MFNPHTTSINALRASSSTFFRPNKKKKHTGENSVTATTKASSEQTHESSLSSSRRHSVPVNSNKEKMLTIPNSYHGKSTLRPPSSSSVIQVSADSFVAKPMKVVVEQNRKNDHPESAYKDLANAILCNDSKICLIAKMYGESVTRIRLNLRLFVGGYTTICPYNLDEASWDTG
ncbi:hypothetical protein HK100_005058 [Physocladia obscura]|uniref:Uncharacterized protein n=1 Tax=Physocladia obscura TaxID=109957 RepID=A0AAD5SS71_9FUNG|nr:hypothetical protein HK100_005058 [Physocladia obscura]